MLTIFLGPFPGLVSGHILVGHGQLIRQLGIRCTAVVYQIIPQKRKLHETILPGFMEFFFISQIIPT